MGDTRILSPSPIPHPPSPEYLVIGHVTVDELATGTAPGGTASYAAVTAAHLGLRAGILTSAGLELDWAASLPGVSIIRAPSSTTTSFENRYVGGRRTQRLLSVADPITADLLPEEWRHAPIVHLGPVAHEVGESFAGRFPHSLVGFTPQGFLRAWDGRGEVRQSTWSGSDNLLKSCDVVLLSEDDISADPGFLTKCARDVPVVILTEGRNGATLLQGGRRQHFPAFPVEEIDPTGAGDVFAAAFLVEYNLTGDPGHSVAFACCAASFAVQTPGLSGIPARAAVERRLALYQTMK